MEKVLKNLQLTFGGTAASPKVLSIASVNTLIKAIEDPDVTTRFSGHIMSETGSINAAQAYALALAGLTFHGNVTPVSFTLAANKTTVVDGSEVVFTTSGVPVSAIDFTVESIVVNSGSLTISDIESICSIEGNKLVVAPAGVTSDWGAVVKINAKTKYTPVTEKSISITIEHRAYSGIGINETEVNFDTPKTVSIPFYFTPVNANVPIESVRATFENLTLIYEVGISSGFLNITCKSVDDPALNKVNIKAVDAAGKIITKSINVSNRVIPDISIVSEDSFIAKNGKGSLECGFGFTPEQYNVGVEFVSVTSSNSLVSVSNASVNGFVLSSTDVSGNTSTVVAAKFKVDGVEKTVTKTINITYKQVFNEFKVYKNSAWVVPSSNIEVKVGNVPTVYIGDGFWMVDETLVNESMNITAGGVILGKYGQNEYSDDSELSSSTTIKYLNFIKSGICTYKVTSKMKLNAFMLTVQYSAYSNSVSDIKIKRSNGTIVSLGSLQGTYMNNRLYCDEYLYKGDELEYYTASSAGYSYYMATFEMSVYASNYNEIKLDLSLASTSLKAINGVLNELATPTTPNGGAVILTGVNSGNSAITATIEDGKIRLAGTVADGNPQTSNLTFYYTVNGYNRSCEIEITATYQEVYTLEAVDLGLPSGVKWANMNVGAEKPWEGGSFFQWGDTTAHTAGENFGYDITTYYYLSAYSISANLSSSNDAANVILGGTWRMPSKADFDELIQNTNLQYASMKNVEGFVLTSKINGKTIFIPAVGYREGRDVLGGTYYAKLWSSTYQSSSQSYACVLTNSPSIKTSADYRYYGFSIRGVQ